MQDTAFKNPVKEEELLWNKRFLLFFWALLFWRITYLLIAPLDLSPDETYYWDWSRHLDWGYYSKPPMVAWIMALSTAILGNTPFGVRFPATILSTLSLWAVYSLGRRMFGAKAGFWAALVGAAGPGASVVALIMTIDAPLICFWSLSMYCLWRALEGQTKNEGEDAKWWIASGLCIGMGLLAKQTMAVFWPLVVLFLILSPEDRHQFSRPWPYISAGLSLLALLPVVWWNYEHNWITLQHTMHHFQTKPGGHGLSLSFFLEFIGSQLVVISPVTWVFMALVGGSCLLALSPRPFRLRLLEQLHRRVCFLVVFSIPALVGILALSLRQRVNANWPAPFYLAASVLIGGWASGHISWSRSLEKLKRFLNPGIAMGATMAVLLYLIPLTLPTFGLDGGPLDPTVRLRGWKNLGTRVREVLQELPGRDKTILVGRKRQTVSELAFYVPGQPEVFCWSDRRREIRSQYDIWQGPADKIGWDALIVINARKGLPQGLSECFDSIEPIDEMIIPLGQAGERRFNLYLGKDLRKWPGGI